MTAEPQASDDMIRAAIARVASGLPADEPGAQVFFEERVDSRLRLSSSGLRDRVITRSRGAAITGLTSVHVSDPDFIESQAGRSPEDWVAGIEAAIVEAGTKAAVGRRQPTWSATLVTFRQDVWVGMPSGSVLTDIRHGSRLELRAGVGNGELSQGIQEMVLRPAGPTPIFDAFVRAFDRGETRAGILSAPEPGITMAVFAPGVAGIVAHELIGHALEGDVVARARTWIGDAPLLDGPREVTVVDDPRLGRGAWLIDDEGVASGETVLIDRGRPVGLLLDRASADTLGRIPNGHGRRSSYLEPVRARMGCTFIARGADDPEEALRSTRSGVFIRRLVGGHTDPISGRATFIVSDSDRIVDGRLAEPLDVFVIELDGPKSWRSIDRVADDLAFDTCIGSCVREGQPMVVSVGAPTIRIGVVRVSS